MSCTGEELKEIFIDLECLTIGVNSCMGAEVDALIFFVLLRPARLKCSAAFALDHPTASSASFTMVAISRMLSGLVKNLFAPNRLVSAMSAEFEDVE
jgi:hypothetical protein